MGNTAEKTVDMTLDAADGKRRHRVRSPHIGAVAVVLFVAGSATAIMDFMAPAPFVPPVIPALILFAAAFGGCMWRGMLADERAAERAVHSQEQRRRDAARIEARIDQVIRNQHVILKEIKAEERKAGIALGYVACATRQCPSCLDRADQCPKCSGCEEPDSARVLYSVPR